MKKILLTLSLQIITALTFAQTVNFGIKAGLTLSNQALTINQYNFNNKNLVGFRIGGFADIGIQKFSIQPGLYYSRKGEEFVNYLTDQNGQNAGTSTIKNKLNYIELPVNLLYKINVAPLIRIYFGGGPCIGYGISGTTSGTDLESGKPYNSKVTFGNNANQSNNYKNPDYGVNFVVGTEIKKTLLVEAGYELGLANISNADGANIKNRSINFSIGYMFL